MKNFSSFYSLPVMPVLFPPTPLPMTLNFYLFSPSSVDCLFS